jgi:hypothetical protein
VKGPFDAFWFLSGIILRVFTQKATHNPLILLMKAIHDYTSTGKCLFGNGFAVIPRESNNPLILMKAIQGYATDQQVPVRQRFCRNP